MAKITYGTKAPFQNNPDIPKENKCTADDLNEIKNVVNQNYDDLETAKANIEELQNGQGTSESDITSLKNRISALETDNTNNKSNITNLQNNKVDKIEGKGLSTEDFTTALKTKLEELQNYDDTEIKKDIKEIKTEQTEQNEEIDLIANMIPTLETEEAEELNVKSSKYYGKLDLEGNTSQEVRSGKNLLNVPSNLVISVYKEIQINLKANNTYTLKFENAIAGADNNQSLITFRNTIDIVSRIINTTTTKEITVQPEQDVTNIRIYASTDYAQSAGKTKTFEKLMVYEGTDEEEYEEYGASPSSGYPSKIYNPEGNVEIKICNKNWVNYKEAETYRTQDTIEIIENGVKWSGNYYFQIPVRLQIGKKYVFSCVSNDFEDWMVKYQDGASTGRVKSGVAVQIEKETSYIYIYKKNQETVKENMLFTNIQLEQRETITDYVEHEEQEITFPLEEGQKLYKGSYLGQEKIHHVRKQIELDGTENYIAQTQINNNIFYTALQVTDMKALLQDNLISSHFKETLTPTTTEGIGATYSNYIYFGINVANIGATAEQTEPEKRNLFKNWLSKQKQAGTPVTIEYALAEEETEEMTEQQKEAHKQLQKIMTYYPETNVTNNQKALMKLTYKMNLNDAIVALQKLSIG